MKSTTSITADRDARPVPSLIYWTAWGWVASIIGLIFLGYQGHTLTEAVSFVVNDGWCPEDGPVVGMHCWGDFGAPYSRFGQETVYVNGNVAAANTPLTVATFEVLRSLPYRVGLSAVLLGIVASVTGALLLAVRRTRGTMAPVLVLLCGIGTVGFISSFDRANWIGLFPLPMFVMAVALGKRRWLIAGLAAGFLISLKFWAVLFLIGFIYRRNYRGVFVAGIVGATLYVLPLLVLPGALTTKVQVMLSAVVDRDFGAGVAKYSVSLPGFFGRLYCMQDDNCNVHWADEKWFTPLWLTMLIVGAATLWALWMVLLNRNDAFLALAPTMALAFIAVPEAAAYNLVACVSIAALFYFQHSQVHFQRTAARFPGTYTAMIGALVMSSVPITIIIGDGSLGSFGFGRWASLIVPLSWMMVIIVSIIERLRAPKTRSPSSTSSTASKVALALTFVTGGIFAIYSIVLWTQGSGFRSSFTIAGGNEASVAIGAGVGSFTELTLRPKNYEAQGADIQLYFPAAYVGGQACSAAMVDFSWQGVLVDIPDLGFVHRFQLTDIVDARLTLDGSGTKLVWSSGTTEQVVEPPQAICLQLNGAQLAAGSQYSVDVLVSSGSGGNPTLSTFDYWRVLPLLFLALLSIWGVKRARESAVNGSCDEGGSADVSSARTWHKQAETPDGRGEIGQSSPYSVE